MVVFFSRFGEFSPIILLNIFSILLAYTYSSMPMKKNKKARGLFPQVLHVPFIFPDSFSFSLSDCSNAVSLSLSPHIVFNLIHSTGKKFH
jgi:hypothetical protein